MEQRAEGRESGRRALAAGLSLLVLVAGCAWLFSTWWQTAAVGAMTEDLVQAGAVDLSAFSRFSGKEASAGAVAEYLQQGHEQRSLMFGLLLWALAGAACALSLFGAARRRPAMEIAKEDRIV